MHIIDRFNSTSNFTTKMKRQATSGMDCGFTKGSLSGGLADPMARGEERIKELVFFFLSFFSPPKLLLKESSSFFYIHTIPSSSHARLHSEENLSFFSFFDVLKEGYLFNTVCHYQTIGDLERGDIVRGEKNRD